MNASLPYLVREARKELGVFMNKDLAEFLGVSVRTVARHAAHGGVAPGDGLVRLVRALYPVNPALAEQIGAATGLTPASLGLVAAATTAARPRVGPEQVALVLCAAADALRMVPSDVRPGLVAIFEQIRALGVDAGDFIDFVIASKPASGARKKESGR